MKLPFPFALAAMMLPLLGLPAAVAQYPAAGGQAQSPAASTSYPGLQAPVQGQSPAGTPAPTTEAQVPAASGAGAARGPSTAQFDASSPTLLLPTTDHAILYPLVQDYTLRQGDMIAIHIFGETDLTPPIRIGAHGQISLPFLQDVQLAGLTVDEAQKMLARRLREAGLYVDPQVSVSVVDSTGALVSVVGELHGVVPVYGSARLINVLSVLGGLSPTSSHVLTISRVGVPQPIVVDLGPDPASSPRADVPVLPGDILTISKAGVVYVLGEFKTQGIFPLSGSGPTTLMQLATLIGGANFPARYKDMRLIRTINGQRQFVTLDMRQVFDGKVPDPIMQPGDILYMPTSQVKAFLTSGSFNSALSVVNLALTVLELGRQ